LSFRCRRRCPSYKLKSKKSPLASVSRGWCQEQRADFAESPDYTGNRWWLFGAGDNRHRLAKHVVIGEFERFEGDVWILVLQKLISGRHEVVFGQESIQRILNRLRCSVGRAFFAAAALFSALLKNHDLYFPSKIERIQPSSRQPFCR